MALALATLQVSVAAALGFILDQNLTLFAAAYHHDLRQPTHTQLEWLMWLMELGI